MKSYVYYNDIDPEVCDWTQKAINAGLLAPGLVDCRPIEQVRPEDIKEFRIRHFFSGIGGWQLALQASKLLNDISITTASCPCQGFSLAGKQGGKKDERHLWPIFFNLFKQSPTTILFGEQVASSLGKHWFDGESDSVADCLQNEGYSVGMAVLPACSVGAFHRRNRLYFGAINREIMVHSEKFGGDGRGSDKYTPTRDSEQPFGGGRSVCGAMGDSESGRRAIFQPENERASGREIDAFTDASASRVGPASYWNSAEWRLCADGKARAIEPGIRLLVDGLPSGTRKVALRGYGNAIVAPLATAFMDNFYDAAIEAGLWDIL